MLRVSTTTLETFRRFMDPANDFTTEADLLAAIRRTVRETPAMRVGTAFGEIIETPERFATPDGAPEGYASRGCFFEHDEMTDVLDAYDRRGPFEVKATKTYGDVVVVAKADQLIGAEVIETKTTTGSFDIDKYLDSAQWRVMADIFQPVSVTYRVWLLREPCDGEQVVLNWVTTATAEPYRVKGCEVFRVYPYPALGREVADLVGAFRAYVAQRGLEGELRAQQRRAEAA